MKGRFHTDALVAVLSELLEIHMNEGSFIQLMKVVETKKILFDNFLTFLCVH